LANLEALRIQILSEQLLDGLRGVGGDLGGLHDGAVAGGDGARQGGQGQVKRVVPGADDQDDAVGIRPEHQDDKCRGDESWAVQF